MRNDGDAQSDVGHRNGERPRGLVIVRNGVVVDPSTWNRGIPVDGGHYVVDAKAPGHQPWSGAIDVGPERHDQRIAVARLAAVMVAPPMPTDGHRSEGLTGRRKLALVLLKRTPFGRRSLVQRQKLADRNPDFLLSVLAAGSQGF